MSASRKLSIFMIIMIIITLIACEQGTDSTVVEEEGVENTLTVNLVNIPETANGNLAHIYAVAFESRDSTIGYQDGMAIATVESGTISAVIKSKSVSDNAPSDNNRIYDNGNFVKLEFYIDLDGNGSVSDLDDAADATTYSVTINGDSVVDADYNNF